MKKMAFFTALLGAQVAFAADCPPAESIDFSGIHLGGDVSNVLDVFPNAELEKETSYSSAVMNTRYYSMEEFAAKLPGFENGDFYLDKQGRINDIKLDYSAEFMETPIETIRYSVIKRFNLPEKGWKTKLLYDKKILKQAGYRSNSKISTLVCKDYTIEITQDFGMGKNAMGPRITIYYNHNP